MSKDKSHMSHRYIELFLNSSSDSNVGGGGGSIHGGHTGGGGGNTGSMLGGIGGFGKQNNINVTFQHPTARRGVIENIFPPILIQKELLCKFNPRIWILKAHLLYL